MSPQPILAIGTARHWNEPKTDKDRRHGEIEGRSAIAVQLPCPFLTGLLTCIGTVNLAAVWLVGAGSSPQREAFSQGARIRSHRGGHWTYAASPHIYFYDESDYLPPIESRTSRPTGWMEISMKNLLLAA